MKRKIFLGLGIYSIVFLLGGLYIIHAIQQATEKVDELIVLHQVEILREHYLIQINRVQQDLSVAGTRFAEDFDTVVNHTRGMGAIIEACFGCHHVESVTRRLEDLRRDTHDYQHALSRVLTMQASPARLAQEEAAAFELGQVLTDKTSQMIALTSARLETYTQKSLREINRTKYVLYLLVGIGPPLAFVLSIVFVSGLTKPLNTLLASTRRLQAGDLDHRVIGLKHEFGELAVAFNDMAASLSSQMKKMQRAEQMALVGQLSAGLAHEIKNPLAGIKVAMQILAEEAGLSDEDQAVVVKVGQEVTRLEALMKSFLSFARPPKPEPVDINVNHLLNTTLAFHGLGRLRGPDRIDGVEIVKRLGEIPRTMADPMQLQQVLLNLVLNALDAMPDGGTLAVHTGLDGENRIRIDIADSGKGVAPEDAETIFQPFFTTKRGGTGLGLAVSRQLLEQQGATIFVGSNPGGGAVFTIHLPVLTSDEGEEA